MNQHLLIFARLIFQSYLRLHQPELQHLELKLIKTHRLFELLPRPRIYQHEIRIYLNHQV